jgi:hypothetical protein
MSNWSHRIAEERIVGGVVHDLLPPLTLKELGGFRHQKGTERLAVGDGVSVGYSLQIRNHMPLYRVIARGSAWIRPALEFDIEEGEIIHRYRPKLVAPTISREEFLAEIGSLDKVSREQACSELILNSIRNRVTMIICRAEVADAITRRYEFIDLLNLMYDEPNLAAEVDKLLNEISINGRAKAATDNDAGGPTSAGSNAAAPHTLATPAPVTNEAIPAQ